MHHMTGWEGGMAGIGLFGVLVMVLFIALIGLVIFAIVRILQEGRHKTPGTRHERADREALSILARRFAEGDITEEEYLRKKQILEEEKEA